ncbi:MAG TPA: hypothetical protein VF741_07405 [Candidatus Aquilonibacter sp.]
MYGPQRRLTLEQSPLERARLWAEILALLAAGAWGIYTFVYQTHIAPLLEPPHLIIGTEAARLGATAGNYLERARVSLTNDGHTSVDVAGYAMTVRGIAAPRPASFLRKSEHGTFVSASYADVPNQGLPVLASRGVLFAASTFAQEDKHIILRPGDVVQLDTLVVVPRDRFFAIAVQTQVVYVRFPYNERVPVQLVLRQNKAIGLTSSASLDQAFFAGLQGYFGV